MAESTSPLEGDVIRAGPPAEAAWVAVPAPFFAGGEPPAFALFDHSRRVADLRTARTVYVAPSDTDALSGYVRRRLPALRGSSRAVAAARAWALHRALVDGLSEVLHELPGGAERPSLMRHVIDLARIAAEWVPAQPALYLAALTQGEQRATTHGVSTALFALTLSAACLPGNADTLAEVTLAGLLADAGKFSVPGAIWQKAGTLSMAEWDLMRQHPERSVALLRQAGVRSAPTLRAVRWHHERWGGGGYPDRLRGNDIPVEARILGIADAFAALTADRPFKAGLRGYDALSEMATTAGQFDPRLLRIFVMTIGEALPARQRWDVA